jgi:hypothetical protein
MPLKKGLTLTPGKYRVRAWLGPIFKVFSAERVEAF